MGLRTWLSHNWKLLSRDPTSNKGAELPLDEYSGGTTYYNNVYIPYSTQSSVLTPLFVKIANDISQLDFRHCRVDNNDNFKEEMQTSLNDCFKFGTNLDQNPDSFLRELVTVMLVDGKAAAVPTVTDVDISKYSNGYDIKELRVGRITHWYGEHVEVELWNPLISRRELFVMPKKDVAIFENPFYASMNASNSTVQRLTKKQQMVDNFDAETANPKKLNILVQFPYTISNNEMLRKAKQRLRDINSQISESELGIAYIDGTEKVIQLNRSIDNGVREEVDYLYKRLLNELGITQGVIDGTADEAAMTNYFNNVVAIIAKLITQELTRKFTTKTGRTQGQRVLYFRDFFKLIPINQFPDMIDKISRNEIMTGNEIRGKIGMQPSDDPTANELRNKNIAKPVEKEGDQGPKEGDLPMEEPKAQNGSAPPEITKRKKEE